MPYYVIRCDEYQIGDYPDVSRPQYTYAAYYSRDRRGGCLVCEDLPEAAMKFDTWAEAAAHAVFVIQHLNDLYDGALDVVRIVP